MTINVQNSIIFRTLCLKYYLLCFDIKMHSQFPSKAQSVSFWACNLILYYRCRNWVIVMSSVYANKCMCFVSVWVFGFHRHKRSCVCGVLCKHSARMMDALMERREVFYARWCFWTSEGRENLQQRARGLSV